MTKTFSSIRFTVLLPAGALAAQTAKQDIKDAGQDMKESAKAAGNAAKKTGSATKRPPRGSP